MTMDQVIRTLKCVYVDHATITQMCQLTGISHTNLKPIVHKLLKLGHITEEPVKSEFGTKRIAYHISDKGVNALHN